MSLQSFLIYRYAEFPVGAVAVATVWYGFNDTVDYFAPLVREFNHTYLRAELVGGALDHSLRAHDLAAAAAVTLTLAATFLALATRVKKLEPRIIPLHERYADEGLLTTNNASPERVCAHRLSFSPPGSSPRSKLVTANDDPETQRNEDFCSCMDAASGANVPEAAVLTASLVYSTPVRQLYVSSKMDCLSCTSSLCSVMRSSTGV